MENGFLGGGKDRCLKLADRRLRMIRIQVSFSGDLVELPCISIGGGA
jgi:hypothetical protein